MKVGDEVAIRDDNGNFTGRGILKATKRGYREVDYSFVQNGLTITVKGSFSSSDIKPVPKP